jgi:N-acetylglucosamine-6-sulfatase
MNSRFPGGAPLFDATTSFVVELHDAGYATGLFGKYMNATEMLEEVPPGWDRWEAFLRDALVFFDYELNEHGSVVHYGSDAGDYSTDLLRDRTLAFTADHAERPFFVMYAPYAPHFDASFFSTTPAPRHVGAFSDIPPWRPDSVREADVSQKPPHIANLRHDYFSSIIASGEHDQWRIEQLQSLLAVDEAIEAILDQLDALAIADHTLVVFTSDNGYMWLEHWLTGKNYAYEESIRVPLLARYPMLISAPKVDSHIVLNLDLASTFLDVAGIAVPERFEGSSLVPLLSAAGEDIDWRSDFVGEHWQLSGTYSSIFPSSTHVYLRTRTWKYIVHEPSFEELYHLPSDPLELDNKAAHPQKYRAVLDTLSARLDALLAE